MRINSIPPKELLSQYVHVREKLAVEAPPSGVDKTELTEKAQTFSLAMKAVKESLARTQRIARLSRLAQVKSGTYFAPGFGGRKIMAPD